MANTAMATQPMVSDAICQMFDSLLATRGVKMSSKITSIVTDMKAKALSVANTINLPINFTWIQLIDAVCGALEGAFPNEKALVEMVKVFLDSLFTPVPAPNPMPSPMG